MKPELNPDDQALEARLRKLTLDEPPSGLDPAQRSRVCRELEFTNPRFCWIKLSSVSGLAATLACAAFFIARTPETATAPIEPQRTAAIHTPETTWASPDQIDARIAAAKSHLYRVARQSVPTPSHFEKRLNSIKTSIRELKADIKKTS